MAQAKREFETICARIAQDHPKENEGVTPIVKPFTEEYIGEEPIIMLWTMMAAVFGVLLIACSNVANLLLARAATRTKEIAVRTALGASRRRIVAQLLTESLLLATIGSLLGIVIAAFGVRWFVDSMQGSGAPFWVDIKLDGVVFAFTAGVTLIAALVSGVIPALQATRTNLNDVLKDESRGSSSLRIGKFSRGLVIAELALSGGLLVGAGFMIQSVVQLSRFDYGVPTSNVFTARVGTVRRHLSRLGQPGPILDQPRAKAGGDSRPARGRSDDRVAGTRGMERRTSRWKGRPTPTSVTIPSTRTGRGHAGMVRDLRGEADRRAPPHPGRYRWHLAGCRGLPGIRAQTPGRPACSWAAGSGSVRRTRRSRGSRSWAWYPMSGMTAPTTMTSSAPWSLPRSAKATTASSASLSLHREIRTASPIRCRES